MQRSGVLKGTKIRGLSGQARPSMGRPPPFNKKLKFSDWDVQLVRAAACYGVPELMIAEAMGMSQIHVNRIAYRDSRKDTPPFGEDQKKVVRGMFNIPDGTPMGGYKALNIPSAEIKESPFNPSPRATYKRLSDTDVRLMRAGRVLGVSAEQLARHFDVTIRYVNEVCDYRARKNVRDFTEQDRANARETFRK